MVNSIKRYVFSKRFLYTLCFIALFAIDWVKGSQAGAIWALSTNLTGAVMAVILFSAYPPKEFLKPVYMIYSAVSIAALAGAWCWWLQNQAAIYPGVLLTAVLNIWLLGIFVIKMFLDVVIHKTKRLRFCKLEIAAAVMLLCMLLSVNEDIWPGWYLVMFGLFYHTEYSREDMNEMKEGMLDGIIVSFFLLQGAAFVFRPYDEVRYNGIYANCNVNACFYGIVWLAFLIRMYAIRKAKDKKWKEVLCFLFAGALTAFVLITGCRTSMLAMISAGFFYVIFADFRDLKDKAGRFLGKLILHVAVVCLSLPVVFVAVRYLPPVFHHPIWYDGEYRVQRVHSFDPWDSEKYISWEECSDMVAGRLKTVMKMIFGEEQAAVMTVHASSPAGEGERIHPVDSSIEVRLNFWKFYMQNGNLRGHSNEEGHDLPDYSGRYIWHSQNVFVQYWYYYGIPAAILFLAVCGALIVTCIKRIMTGQDNALICLLFVVFWLMYGMAESVWYPGQMAFFLVFFTPKFLLKEDRGQEDDSSELLD